MTADMNHKEFNGHRIQNITADMKHKEFDWHILQNMTADIEYKILQMGYRELWILNWKLQKL